MGLGCSAYMCEEDWRYDSECPSVKALTSLFFRRGGHHALEEIASVIALLADRCSPAGQVSECCADLSWWQTRVAGRDSTAAAVVFSAMSVDAAGTTVNLYQVLTCAVVLSPQLSTEAKVTALCGLASVDCDKEECGRVNWDLNVPRLYNLVSAVLLGLHRLSVLLPSPPKPDEVENDICRLLWIFHKRQPQRGDILALEELLFVAVLDDSLRPFFASIGSASALAAEISSLREVPSQAGPAPGGRVQGGGHLRAPTEARQVRVAPISSVTASAVLSRREVVQIFDIFKEIRAELDRLPKHGKPRRDTSSIRAFHKIKNTQVQGAAKKTIGRGQVLELRHFLQMFALSKAPAAFTDAHLDVFEGWIRQRVPLSVPELAKYGLEAAASTSSAPSQEKYQVRRQQLRQGAVKGQLCGGQGQRAGNIRKLQSEFRRAVAPECRAWLRRKQAALGSYAGQIRRYSDINGELALTLEEMVIWGVVPGELAAAAVRTFGWKASRVLTEGAFLELFVPCAPNDYHSLDFMRIFRHAWLRVHAVERQGPDVPGDSNGYEQSWIFLEGDGANVPFNPRLDGHGPPSRRRSAPPVLLGLASRSVAQDMMESCHVSDETRSTVLDGSKCTMARSRSAGLLDSSMEPSPLVDVVVEPDGSRAALGSVFDISTELRVPSPRCQPSLRAESSSSYGDDLFEQFSGDDLAPSGNEAEEGDMSYEALVRRSDTLPSSHAPSRPTSGDSSSDARW